MLRATRVASAGTWSDLPADTVSLDYTDRHRRRIRLTAAKGLTFVLDLPRVPDLKEGDGLVLDDGRIVAVQSARESLHEIRCQDGHHLTKVAWHLGNRHLPTEIGSMSLRIRRDHVVAAMVEQLGAEVSEISAPFNPEEVRIKITRLPNIPMVSTGRTIMTTITDLTTLMTWLSPGYPVGGYSYSHGLEWLVESGDVRDLADLKAWLEDVLLFGSGLNDAIIFAESYRAAQEQDASRVREVVELAAAFSPSSERHLETMSQGEAFRIVTQEVWEDAEKGPIYSVGDERLAFPVSVALAAAYRNIPLKHALASYLHGMFANLVSAGVRLIPLGQTDGQRALAHMLKKFDEVIDTAVASTLDDLGGCSVTIDMSSMYHETQYTRLFRS